MTSSLRLCLFDTLKYLSNLPAESSITMDYFLPEYHNGVPLKVQTLYLGSHICKITYPPIYSMYLQKSELSFRYVNSFSSLSLYGMHPLYFPTLTNFNNSQDMCQVILGLRGPSDGFWAHRGAQQAFWHVILPTTYLPDLPREKVSTLHILDNHKTHVIMCNHTCMAL